MVGVHIDRVAGGDRNHRDPDRRSPARTLFLLPPSVLRAMTTSRSARDDMPLNRRLLEEPFTANSGQGFDCPSCHRGALVVDINSVQEGPTGKTLQDEADSQVRNDNWDYSYYEGRFGFLMRCSYCRQTVAVAGVSRYVDRRTCPHEYEYERALFPQYFSPPPDLFRIPENCSEEIAQQVRTAFSLYWCDPGACLNRLRLAVELLLTEMEIDCYSEKDGRRSPITLDSRINMLRKRHAALSPMCDQLLAVKWLGNAGSHPEEITRDSVYDALDIVDYVLSKRFENSERRVSKISSEINQKKGPR